MAASERPITETRADQMFPVLELSEIDRLRRFGEPRSYSPGERLSTTGEVGAGIARDPGRHRRDDPAR
jgi:thioredoxin reductase (NADPH)